MPDPTDKNTGDATADPTVQQTGANPAPETQQLAVVADVAEKPPHYMVKLVTADWTVDAVQFPDKDGNTVTIARSTGHVFDDESDADALVQAGSDAGFALTKETVA